MDFQYIENSSIEFQFKETDGGQWFEHRQLHTTCLQQLFTICVTNA